MFHLPSRFLLRQHALKSSVPLNRNMPGRGRDMEDDKCINEPLSNYDVKPESKVR